MIVSDSGVTEERLSEMKSHIAMRRFAAVIIALLVTTTLAAAAADRGPSTPEERQRFLAITEKMQNAPFDKTLRSEREWALRWLIEVPDVQAKLCGAVLGDFLKSKYKYSPEITAQVTFSEAAFSIKNPDRASDDAAQYLAGIEGALNAYNAILKAQPNAKSKPLDDLLQKQKQGQLKPYVQQASQECSKTQ